MNDAMLNLLDRIVDNAIEEYHLEAELIDSVETFTPQELHYAGIRMHDRIVMSNIPALSNAPIERVESYLHRRIKLRSLQTMIDRLHQELDDVLEADDDRLLSEAGHLDLFNDDNF